MIKIKHDLTGQKFERLTVIKRVEDYIYPSGQKRSKWLCRCECGNEIVVTANNLRTGNTKSCGCIQKEHSSISNKIRLKKYNTYNLDGEYGIGYTEDGKEFYFDKEDYDLITKDNYYWVLNDFGYVCTSVDHKKIFMHKLITNTDSNTIVDHIITENKNDNRKSNLRIVTSSQNGMNVKIRNNNTSGCVGVYYAKYMNKWRARITLNGKRIELGSFINFEDAVKARKEAEEEYFGKYSYDNSQKQKIS